MWRTWSSILLIVKQQTALKYLKKKKNQRQTCNDMMGPAAALLFAQNKRHTTARLARLTLRANVATATMRCNVPKNDIKWNKYKKKVIEQVSVCDTRSETRQKKIKLHIPKETNHIALVLALNCRQRITNKKNVATCGFNGMIRRSVFLFVLHSDHLLNKCTSHELSMQY